jgi:hypothetical protein
VHNTCTCVYACRVGGRDWKHTANMNQGDCATTALQLEYENTGVCNLDMFRRESSASGDATAALVPQTTGTSSKERLQRVIRAGLTAMGCVCNGNHGVSVSHNSLYAQLSAGTLGYLWISSPKVNPDERVPALVATFLYARSVLKSKGLSVKSTMVQSCVDNLTIPELTDAEKDAIRRRVSKWYDARVATAAGITPECSPTAAAANAYALNDNEEGCIGAEDNTTEGAATLEVDIEGDSGDDVQRASVLLAERDGTGVSKDATPTSCHMSRAYNNAWNEMCRNLIPAPRELTVMEKDMRALLIPADQCAYCGGPPTTTDHFRPIISRETSMPSGYCSDLWNTVPCCVTCNCSKGNRHWREFMDCSKGKTPLSRKTAGAHAHGKRVAALAMFDTIGRQFVQRWDPSKFPELTHIQRTIRAAIGGVSESMGKLKNGIRRDACTRVNDADSLGGRDARCSGAYREEEGAFAAGHADLVSALDERGAHVQDMWGRALQKELELQDGTESAWARRGPDDACRDRGKQCADVDQHAAGAAAILPAAAQTLYKSRFFAPKSVPMAVAAVESKGQREHIHVSLAPPLSPNVLNDEDPDGTQAVAARHCASLPGIVLRQQAEHAAASLTHQSRFVCTSGSRVHPGGGATEPTDAETETDTEVDAETETDTETDAETDTETGTGSDSDQGMCRNSKTSAALHTFRRALVRLCKHRTASRVDFCCNQVGCAFVTRTHHQFRLHVLSCHCPPAFRPHVCDEPGCAYGTYKTHMMRMHTKRIHGAGDHAANDNDALAYTVMHQCPLCWYDAVAMRFVRNHMQLCHPYTDDVPLLDHEVFQTDLDQTGEAAAIAAFLARVKRNRVKHTAPVTPTAPAAALRQSCSPASEPSNASGLSFSSPHVPSADPHQDAYAGRRNQSLHHRNERTQGQCRGSESSDGGDDNASVVTLTDDEACVMQPLTSPCYSKPCASSTQTWSRRVVVIENSSSDECGKASCSSGRGRALRKQSSTSSVRSVMGTASQRFTRSKVKRTRSGRPCWTGHAC